MGDSTIDLLKGSESDDEDRHSVMEEKKEFEKAMMKKEEKLLAKKYERDFVVNAGFGFEITDYFMFESKYLSLH